MFLHSNVYPDYDEAFNANFALECEGIIRQVRNHPCLALLCGGNEQREAWDEWGWKQLHDHFFGEKLITQIIPPIAERLCPEIPFIDNSPHGGITSQSPVIGECHNWGNFYNSTKDPLFVTETCWTQESYSRPQTLGKWMGLDVNDYTGNAWSEKWTAATSLQFFNRMPYTNWFHPETLTSYLHGLELEQMRADYSALSKFRYESPSNTGVIYWSFTKGGPLFQFGCVDYDGYPMMSYYVVKRIFAPIGIYPYRDVSDMCVMASNHSKETANVVVKAKHLLSDGTVLFETSENVSLEAGATQRAIRVPDLYTHVVDRTHEMFYTAVYRNDELVSEDIFYFCPFGEYEGIYKPLRINTAKIDGRKWQMDIASDVPVRSVEIECNHKIMLSDNYFPTANGKTVELTILEHTSDEPIVVTVSALGSEEKQTFVLEG
jgi:beta-mannosidase